MTSDGSILRAYDLNVSQLQTIHVAEEARDLTADTIGVNNNGDLDARGRRIVNLANAVDDRDAVSLGQIKSINQNAWTARDQAEAFKNQAKGFRDEAEVSRNAAEAAKARAGASELKAKEWATSSTVVEGDLKSAKSYAQDAHTSEVNAHNSQTAADASQRHAANSQAAAAISQEAAAKATERAEKWAQEAPNVVVTAGRYSAYHWSTVAKAEANKLGNWNALAGQVEVVDGNTVAFKQRLAARNVTIRVDQKGTGTQSGVVQIQNTRKDGEKSFSFETYANIGKKRNDIYTFLANDPATWPTGRSAGNGLHSLKGDVSVSKGLAVGGGAAITGQVISSNADNYRINYGGYGTFWRNDGQRLYLMVTNKGDPTGSWNNFRPFYMDLTNGHVTLGNGLAGDLVQHQGKYQNISTPGAGSLAGQLNAEGAYSHHLPGNQDGNVYYPMVKQYGRRSNGYPTAFSMGMVSQGKSGFHIGYINLIGDNNKAASWSYDMDGRFTTSHITCRGHLDVYGTHVNYSATGLVMKNAGRRHIQYNTGSVIDGYIYKDAGAGSYHINWGSSAQCDFELASNGMLKCSKGWTIAADGNLYGSKWGGVWLDAWINNHFKHINAGWTELWHGTMGHSNGANLPQSINWRTIWIVTNGHLNAVHIGGDGMYFISSHGGWLRFKVSNGGKRFDNVEDRTSVPTKILVENQ